METSAKQRRRRGRG